MENIPGIIEKKRIPIQIPIDHFLLDHIFDARAVLPAVESMELLSASISKECPDYRFSSLSDIELKKFITIPKNEGYIEAFNDIEIYDNNTLISNLITIKKAKSSSITRKQEHISIRYKMEDPQIKSIPWDIASYIEGIAFTIAGDDLYRDLVPFGPSYHNIEKIFLTENGAAAYLNSGSDKNTFHTLGSPFTLDAAFHGACAWGQRFLGFVGFPVSMKKRIVLKPTVFNDRYFCRIIPTATNEESFLSNIYIYDKKGNLSEIAEDLTMRDISRGRMESPNWVRNNIENHNISRINDLCDSLSIIELDTISEFADNALSETEKERTTKMGEKRIRSYMSARLACKGIARKISGYDYSTKSEDITTIDIETPFPLSPFTNKDDTINCTVSHNARFAVAAASKKRIGVDVETISDRAVKTKKFYTSEKEQLLIKESNKEESEAFIRIWTIKEAVAKACHIDLTDAWKRTEVTQFEKDKSTFLLDHSEETAHHKKVDNNIFTFVILEDKPSQPVSRKKGDN